MKKIFALSVALGVFLFTSAQELDMGRVHANVSKARKEHKIPGLAIGIVKNGEIIFQQGYGVTKMGEAQKVNTSSMFGIASLSKAFTAAAMGMLVDDGKIKWSDKVTDILPNWKLHDEAVTSMFTIEDLMCHRSGLKTFDGDLLWYGSNYSRDEIITRIRHLPLSYDFRAGYGYQNIMYITAGQVIEKVSGMSWDDFVTTRILKPLSMFKTNTSITKYKEGQNIAYPHLKGVPQSLLNYDNSGATAAMNSNVVDMQKWIMFLLSNGIYHGDTLLQPSTLKKIWSVHNPLAVSAFDERNGTHFKGYGMGWFLMDYQGMKVVNHGGGLPGYITKVALIPEKNMGIVIMSNDMSPVCTAIMYEILDMLAGEKNAKDWSLDFAKYGTRYDSLELQKVEKQNQARNKETTPSVELLSYAGTYTDSYYGNATLSVLGKGKKARLQLVLEPAKELFTATLDHWENDTFVFNFNDEFLPRGFAKFELSDGKVVGFTIDLSNPDFHFSNLNFKR
ncbi:MAG: hypothetical protein CL840_09585 [Crocinitomicaceae bacterium]|nr:hypothetical protein [Crocinitomicaceae bacterium]|tara:strand:- start:4625 stop:6139 length:1515 start_codon:yes stop_codon:yes gene_type:complete